MGSTLTPMAYQQTERKPRCSTLSASEVPPEGTANAIASLTVPPPIRPPQRHTVLLAAPSGPRRLTTTQRYIVLLRAQPDPAPPWPCTPFAPPPKGRLLTPSGALLPLRARPLCLLSLGRNRRGGHQSARAGQGALAGDAREHAHRDHHEWLCERDRGQGGRDARWWIRRRRTEPAQSHRFLALSQESCCRAYR